MSNPEDLGLSSRQLARIEPHLEERYLAHKKIPGALTLVARRGQVAHLSVQGHSDVARGRPLTEDTLFRIYSMTKPITSVALMTLYEEGRVPCSDDPVHKLDPGVEETSSVYVAGQLSQAS